jgi:hypothetical protein
LILNFPMREFCFLHFPMLVFSSRNFPMREFSSRILTMLVFDCFLDSKLVCVRRRLDMQEYGRLFRRMRAFFLRRRALEYDRPMMIPAMAEDLRNSFHDHE